MLTRPCQVSLVFTGDRLVCFVNCSQLDRWEEVITHKRSTLESSSFPAGRLVVSALLEFIDGEGGIIGSATIDRAWQSIPFGSLAGTMTFDTGNIADLEEQGSFQSVVLHEMLHVIGFGWVFRSYSDCSLDTKTCESAVQNINSMTSGWDRKEAQ